MANAATGTGPATGRVADEAGHARAIVRKVPATAGRVQMQMSFLGSGPCASQAGNSWPRGSNDKCAGIGGAGLSILAPITLLYSDRPTVAAIITASDKFASNSSDRARDTGVSRAGSGIRIRTTNWRRCPRAK